MHAVKDRRERLVLIRLNFKLLPLGDMTVIKEEHALFTVRSANVTQEHS